ncbi:MAG: type I-G CRISPR-associated protein Csb2, partial [Vicinamibacterales bacterium]
MRQARTFPTIIPAADRFSFIWPIAAPESLRSALNRLCDRVTRLGHSSSLVRCAVVEREVSPNLTPHDAGQYVLRVVEEGQLARLEGEFARHQAVEIRVLHARPQRYRNVDADATPKIAPPASNFSTDWIVYERVGGARPLAAKCVDVARALRAALIEQCGSSPVPEWLSGHANDGQPTSEAHVAFVALPFVGHPNADGSIQGCAIIQPSDWDRSSRELLLRLIAKWEASRGVQSPTGDGNILELAGTALPSMLIRRTSGSPQKSLDPFRWCRTERRFVTATPIALDRNPGDLRSNRAGKAHRSAMEAQETISRACARIGLPTPASVEVALA